MTSDSFGKLIFRILLFIRLDFYGDVEVHNAEYDWTCTSKYWGKVAINSKYYESSETNLEELDQIDEARMFCSALRCCTVNLNIQILSHNESSPIPIDLLSDTSLPILWYQQVSECVYVTCNKCLLSSNKMY